MKALVTVVTNPIPLPVGQTPGQYRLTLTRVDGTVPPVVLKIDTVTDAQTFDGLTAGDYTVEAARLAADESVIGTPVTTSFNVTEQATVDVPASVTVSLQ
jgi:hypothetical protein